MSRASKRRSYLRRLGALVAAGGFAAVPATAHECDTTVYRNATRDGERVLEVPAGEATVTGESACQPGTELEFQARATGGSSPFVRSAYATVGEAGGFAATIDLGDVEPETTFTLTVYHDNEELTVVENAVVAADAATPHPTPTATPTPTPSPTRTPSPTSTPTRTPTDESRDAGDGAATETGGGSADDGDAGGSDSDDADSDGSDPDGSGSDGTGSGGDDLDDGTSAETNTGAPGFEVATAVGGLALAAWRLLNDR